MKTNTSKKEKIITSTLELFSRTHNINKVSLETIAASAGVSPTTIYNLFGTRENLIIEVVKLLTRKNLEHNRQIISSEIPFLQKISVIISKKQDIMSKYDAELIEKIVKQDTAMRPFIDEIYQQELKPLWLLVIKEGKQQGYIDENVDDEVFLIYLDVFKAGLAARQDLMSGLMQDPVKVLQITGLMFNGLLKKPVNLFAQGGTNNAGTSH